MGSRVDTPLELTGWYGDPLPEAEAGRWLEAARRARQARLRAGEPCRPCQLTEMIARYWLGRAVDGDYQVLRATAAGRAEQARVELVYGQLLMACKRAGAHARLRRGLALAAPCLDGPGYLAVRKRHALLERLPTTPAPAAPRPLEALLREARVIARLQGPVGGVGGAARRDDTVG